VEATAEAFCLREGQPVENLPRSARQTDEAARNGGEVLLGTLSADITPCERAVLEAEPNAPAIEAVMPVLHEFEEYRHL